MTGRLQIKAARALLDWTQADLAQAANVGLSTLADFERGAREPIRAVMASILVALTHEGIRFVPGGVILERRES
ncbi:helix-turn-helix protein [Bajunvirus bajun]|uniref:Helix-turn-helix protein n=1 Tax=Brevundimonas phage vB_BgoS-Bajun TaxID=2948594 RepID=A0A9E7N6L5_9CAUD|nr:helix-turn-helix protein [Brevundimonas phage vB_BgoS-Bajun]